MSTKYYSFNDLNTYNNYSLKILSLNIRSISKNFDLLQSILHSSNCAYFFDIIIFSECWLNSVSMIQYSLHNYSAHYCSSNTNKCSGLYVFIKSNIKALTTDLSTKNICDFLKLEFKKDNINYNIMCIYRSPSCDPKLFINLLKGNIPINSNNTDIIVGDLNFNLNDTRIYQKYIIDIISLGFMSLINEATHINKKSVTTIDHIYIRNSLYNSNDSISGVVCPPITDHLPTFLLYNKNSTNEEAKLNFKYKYSEISKEIFTQRLLDFISTFQIEENKSIDENIEFYFQKIKNIHDTSFKKGFTNKNSYKHDWMNQSILQGIKRKNYLFKIYKFTNKQSDWIEFVNYRNYLCKLIKCTKQNYYVKKLSNCTSIKDNWKTINSIIKPQKNQTIQKMKTINDEITTDPELISNTLNHHFAKISQTNRTQTFPRTYGENTVLQQITHNMVNLSIKKLKKTSKTDIYYLPKWLLTEISPVISTSMACLYNKCIKANTFPQCMKNAYIIPIHKNNSKLESHNYRPISILPWFSKIFEYIIYKMLSKFMYDNNIISQCQYGFKEKASTSDALLHIINLLSKSGIRNLKSVCIFIDFVKAFDKVDHYILLKKLNNYGIYGNDLEFLKSYLQNRKLRTITNETTSKEISINLSVPQGSILGPLLFNVYINDLINYIDGGDIVAFADDTSLIISSPDIATLKTATQRAISQLHNWCTINYMEINKSKTKCMFFNVPNNFSVYYDNYLIEVVDNFKLLGITIDKLLTFKIHEQTLISKLKCLFHIFYKVRHIFPFKSKLLIFHALVLSRINYCIHIYGINNNSINKLSNIHTKLLKCLFQNQTQNVKVLTPHSLLKLSMYKFIHKCIINNATTYCTQTITDHISPRHTDYLLFTLFPKPKKMYSIIFNLLEYYNNLPKNFRSFPTNNNMNILLLQYKKSLISE